MEFGKELRRIRESRGITVNQLSIYSGVSSASISRYETGSRTPKAPTIEKLAKGLKYDYKELMRIAGYGVIDGQNEEEVYIVGAEERKLLIDRFDKLSERDQEIILRLMEDMKK